MESGLKERIITLLSPVINNNNIELIESNDIEILVKLNNCCVTTEDNILTNKIENKSYLVKEVVNKKIVKTKPLWKQLLTNCKGWKEETVITNERYNIAADSIKYFTKDSIIEQYSLLFNRILINNKLNNLVNLEIIELNNNNIIFKITEK